MVHAAASDLRARLRAGLDPDPAHEAPPGDRLAAVLALVLETPRPSLVFTVRAAALSRHAGEISFPGGLLDPGESLAHAAVREAHEEIGLDPALPEVLGALAPVHTHVSGILVVPFVGVLAVPPAFRVSDAEIDEILTFTLRDLAAAERATSIPREGGGVWHGWTYAIGGHTVWGATGWMLHTLLELMRKETPWILES